MVYFVRFFNDRKVFSKLVTMFMDHWIRNRGVWQLCVTKTYLHVCHSWSLASTTTRPELSNGELHGDTSNQWECKALRGWPLECNKALPYNWPLLRNKLYCVDEVFARSVKASHTQGSFCPSGAFWNRYEPSFNVTCSTHSTIEIRGNSTWVGTLDLIPWYTYVCTMMLENRNNTGAWESLRLTANWVQWKGYDKEDRD